MGERSEEQMEVERNSNFFLFFSRVFYEAPTASFLNSVSQAVREGGVPNPFQNREAEVSFQKLGNVDGELEDALLLEYNQLFVGPQEMLAPPYGSFYLNREKEFFSEETRKVQQFYLSCGMQFEQGGREPSDHAGLELMFVGLLMGQLSPLFETGREEERTILEKRLSLFLNNHLFPWVFEWLTLVRRHSRSDFYSSMAILAEDFLLKIRLVTPSSEGGN